MAECLRALLVAPRSSYRVAAYLGAAERLGISLRVASDGHHSLVPEIAGGIRIPLDDVDEAVRLIVDEHRRGRFAAILSCDDAATEIASLAASTLGLPGNPPQAARIARRKDLARAALRAAGVATPRHRCIDLELPLSPQLAQVSLPCVVKPLAMSGSRGVIRADDLAALEAAVGRAGAIAMDASERAMRRQLLVEDFLPGREVAVEGMLERGELHPIAMFDKPNPLDGPFFEETYYITPSRLDAATRARILDEVARACAAYGLMHGPVHAELRVHAGEPRVLEVAARTIGGDCARLVRFGTGRTLEELVLAHALGIPVDDDLGTGLSEAAAGVLMLPITRAGVLRRVEGVLDAQRVPGIEEVTIAVREGYELVPLPEGSSYLGFVFARGPDPATVEAALRRAHACLRVVVAPAWRLEPGPVTGAPLAVRA